MLNVFGMSSDRYDGALAVQDAGDRRGEEPVDALVEAQRRADEQELGERPRMEGQRDLGRDRLASPASPAQARAGGRDAGASAPPIAHDPLASSTSRPRRRPSPVAGPVRRVRASAGAPGRPSTR